MKTRIVLLGPPAAGKGTQAELIKARYGIEATSPGAMLREELRLGSAIGLEADRFTSRGELAPDSVVIGLLKSWLSKHSESFVFDGFPRTVVQGESLEGILEEAASKIDVVFFFKVSDFVIRDRVLLRVTCEKCGLAFGSVSGGLSEGQSCPSCSGFLVRRRDDTLEALEQRMIVYREKTEPLVDFYRRRGVLHELSAESDPETVFAQIVSSLEAV